MACDTLQLVFTVSNTTPVVDEVVSCTATVTNIGATTETYHIIFSADGAEFNHTGSIPLGAGNIHGTTVSFTATSTGSANICADLVCDTPVSTPTITITSPNGGEVLLRGVSNTITWTYTGDPGATVSLYLYKGHMWNRNIALGVPVGSGGIGSRTFTLPPDGETGSTYTIAIYSDLDTRIGDESNGFFTLSSPTDVVLVTSPVNGESWVRGTSRTIRWTYSGNVGTTVNLYLYLGHMWNRNIAANVSIGTAGTGSYTWTVPTVVAAGTTYSVMVQSVSNNYAYDESTGYFSVT